MRGTLLLLMLAATAAGKDKAKDGPYVTQWPSGKKKEEGTRRNGQLQGICRAWHENGKLRYEHEYDKGEWHGRRVEYYDNGQVMLDWVYREGKPTGGTWVSYHKNGAFQTSWKFNNNGKAPPQTQKAYHDNGKLAYTGKWKKEKQQGKWSYYYKSGKKKEERRYKDGQAHGWVTKWDEEGKVISRVEYKRGKRKK